MDVLKQLAFLRHNTASSPDGMSSTMLRNTAQTICPVISTIFNLSLATSTVPSDWKIGRVTPIHKSGDKSLACNYRPITLLSLVSKVLERLVHNTVMQFVLEHGHLSSSQFDFHSFSSKQETLVVANRDWHNCLEMGSVVCIFLDVT